MHNVRGCGAVSWFSEKGLRLYLPGRDESITSRVVDGVLRDVDGMIEFGRHACDMIVPETRRPLR